MSESTNSKHREELNTLFGHEKTHNLNASKELIKRYQIENTPFQIIGNEEKGYFIAFGQHRITEIFGIREINEERIRRKADEIIKMQNWHIICNLALIMYQGAKDIEKLKEQ